MNTECIISVFLGFDKIILTKSLWLPIESIFLLLLADCNKLIFDLALETAS